MLFLQVIGGIVLGILVLILMFYVFIRIKFGQFLNAEPKSEPLVVHLNKDINPEWIQGQQPKQYIETLKSIGFAAGDAYLIREMEGTQLVSMHQGPICAVVYLHDMAGCWVDMVLNEIDGLEFTVSNVPMGAAIEAPENCHKVMDPTLSVEEIYQQIIAFKNNSQHAFEDINEENFRAFFETTYKKEMAWRIRKGGISFNEFIGTSEEGQFKTSDHNIQKAFIQMKEDELDDWHEAALEHYQKSHEVADDTFWEEAHDFLVVPFTTAAEAFINYLESRGFMSESQAEKYKQLHADETDIFGLFDTINGHLSPELRAQFIADQDFPLPLKIFKSKDI